jgi:hypothetical protein
VPICTVDEDVPGKDLRSMNNDPKRRDIPRGEAKSMIHWGADIEEVLALLRANYGIEGDEADAIVLEALSARRSAIRKKALLGLVVAAIGLAVPVAYFAIQGFVGFVVIGLGPIFMALLGLASLSMAGRSLYRLLTGEVSGPA